MTDFLALAQPGVQQLSPYVPGKPVDELARELNLDPASMQHFTHKTSLIFTTGLTIWHQVLWSSLPLKLALK